MMTFKLDVQNQWFVVALLTGGALMLITLLTCQAMWRPREEESKRESEIRVQGPISFFQWVLTFMPWPLVLIIVGTLVYGVAHTVMGMT